MNRLKNLLPKVAILMLATVLARCSPDVQSSPEMTSRDSAGIHIVENHLGTGLPALHAFEIRRIGLVEGDDPYLFSQVGSVVVSQSDTLFVGDSQSGTIRVFSPDGTFVRDFGGVGDGPHEVRMVRSVWLSGDTVVVWDVSRPGKTVLFETSGRFITSWSGTLTDGTMVIPRATGDEGWVAEVRSRTALLRENSIRMDSRAFESRLPRDVGSSTRFFWDKLAA